MKREKPKVAAGASFLAVSSPHRLPLSISTPSMNRPMFGLPSLPFLHPCVKAAQGPLAVTDLEIALTVTEDTLCARLLCGNLWFGVGLVRNRHQLYQSLRQEWLCMLR